MTEINSSVRKPAPAEMTWTFADAAGIVFRTTPEIGGWLAALAEVGQDDADRMWVFAVQLLLSEGHIEKIS